MLCLNRLQNDFSLFGIKFSSKRPVPIDSLITNLAETAYVVRKLVFMSIG
jgi:hypothetical protein